MLKTHHFSQLLQLNLAVLFISTSGVLGRYIDLPVPLTIFIRALLAGAILWIYIRAKKIGLKIKKGDRLGLILSGFFMGLHWVTYFHSLQISNVAIAIISLYTFPIITALLEPLILKTKFHKSHLITGGIVILGMYIINPVINFESDNFKGACFGVLYALCYALRNICIKPKVAKYNQSSLMFFQMLVVSIILVPSLYHFNADNVVPFLPALSILALVTTVIGHTMFIKSLKHFTASSASLISSMQPLYGIILAFLLLDEQPRLNTLIGGCLVISAVVIESYRTRR